MKIAIIFGGMSHEHQISIVSSIALKTVVCEELEYIFLDSNREFYSIPSNAMNIQTFFTGQYKRYAKVQLSYCGFRKKKWLGYENVSYDVILNLIHGGDGEDGVLSSLLLFYRQPFIGPRVEASTVSSNKFLTKCYAKECHVKVLDYQCIDSDSVAKVDRYPIIVKPARLGSSIGVSIVKKEDELSYALDTAFEYDHTIIIEPFIEGIKEYNLAGCKVGEEFVFSIVEEPIKKEYLDFDQKYLDFSRQHKVQKASIDDALEKKLKESFKQLYSPLFDGALIRCDFFVMDDEVYLNEINAIPGSMAHYLFSNFNDVLIKLANNLPQDNHPIPVTYEYINTILGSKTR